MTEYFINPDIIKDLHTQVFDHYRAYRINFNSFVFLELQKRYPDVMRESDLQKHAADIKARCRITYQPAPAPGIVERMCFYVDDALTVTGDYRMVGGAKGSEFTFRPAVTPAHVEVSYEIVTKKVQYEW